MTQNDTTSVFDHGVPRVRSTYSNRVPGSLQARQPVRDLALALGAELATNYNGYGHANCSPIMFRKLASK